MSAKVFLKLVTFYARFTPNYTKIGYFARRLFWGRSKPLDFRGQRWLVTGASAGIGKAIMHAAATAGAEVVAVARSQQRLDAAIAELDSSAAARVSTLVADMSLQSDTQDLLERLLASGMKFDVLQNNLGILLPKMTITREGRETTFVINVLSHFLLTEGLADNGAFNDDAIVVNMTSGGMYTVPLGLRALNTTIAKYYNGKYSYAHAKRAQVVLTGYWNQKYGPKGLKFYVTHPGWAKTPGVKKALPVFWKIQNLILRTPLQGADTALWLCTARPPITEEEVVWFDRAPRSTHVYEETKVPKCTVDELVAYFGDELSKQVS